MSVAGTLEDFIRWWLNFRPLIVPVDSPVLMENNSNISGVVLYRAPPWQVELFIAQPNCVLRTHRHPNVDSFEVYLGGDIEFILNGESKTTFHSEPNFNGNHRFFGEQIRVRPEDWHGGKIGPQGGTFLSVQKWTVPPTSVGLDWEEDH